MSGADVGCEAEVGWEVGSLELGAEGSCAVVWAEEGAAELSEEAGSELKFVETESPGIPQEAKVKARPRRRVSRRGDFMPYTINQKRAQLKARFACIWSPYSAASGCLGAL